MSRDVEGTTPMLACRVVNPVEYDPVRRRIWENSVKEIEERGELAPQIYPNSVMGVCFSCGVRVAIGPMQQEHRKQFEDVNLDCLVACMLCAVQVAAAGNPHVLSLGNQHDFTAGG